MKKIFFLLILFVSFSIGLYAKDSITFKTYLSAPHGDYENIKVNSTDIYNVISNPDPAVNNPSGANFLGDFRFVNVNRGLRIFGSCVGDFSGTLGLDANAVDLNSLNYIELNPVAQEIFLKDQGQISSVDNTHRLLFRTADNIMELREFGDIIFSSGATPGDETSKMIILANGNTGIGTKNPATKLEVATFDSITSGLSQAGDVRITDDAPQLDFIDIDAKDWAIQVNSNKMYFVRQTWKSKTLVLTENGVGIGTSDPLYTLDVAGTANATSMFINGIPVGKMLVPFFNESASIGVGKEFSIQETNLCVTALGNYVLEDLTTGKYNTAFGYKAMQHTKTGSHNVAVGALALMENISGSYNVAIGSEAGRYSKGSKNVFIGYAAGKKATGHGNVCIGYQAGYNAVGNELYIDNSSTNNPLIYGDFNDETVKINGDIIKTTSNFEIPHPDPAKAQQGMLLRHSTVESPTAGDNVYRFVVDVKDGQAEIKLPDYYKYLNENTQVWVMSAQVFGVGYGKIDDKQEKIMVKTEKDGVYNVLVIGTRKDKHAKMSWERVGGVETIEDTKKKH